MWTSTLRISFVALLLAAVSPRALAQDDTGPVEQCLARVRTVAHNTADFNHRTADRTVHAIRVLDNQGAPDRAIVGSGRMGKIAIDRHAANATRRIRHIVQVCVTRLQDNDAPPAAIAIVVAGGHAAVEAVETSQNRSKGRINHAVANAIE